MDKNVIKKFAIWARRELIERVSQRAAIYGITAENYGDPEAESINGKLLSESEKNQRRILINSIKEKGFEQVIEEVAYTWFNRFAALRFMEVNGYLPSHIRVFTNEAGEFKPQILSEAIHLDLEGLNKDKVYELENDNKTEELFKYLLVVQCNALNSILPGMFQRIDDYTELLLPDNLLREGSVIEKLVVQGTSDSIPESDWTDQVQIIGWLYQYYNNEPKDKVFADLKKNIKITKEKIPAATQLFTPDWIVHYMVENSLGRLWLEGHPNASLKAEWKYYLDEAEQEPEVQEQLEKIRKEYAGLKPEEIKVIDPCSGSGHILCVLFDVLVRIYEDFGHTAREAVTSIIKNNLWGLDIDERAAQLSYFAVMMKARQYDRRFLAKKDADGNPDIPQPHVYVIEESNSIKPEALNELGQNLIQYERDNALEQINKLIEEMYDAKEYGSLTGVSGFDWNLLRRFAKLTTDNGQMRINMHDEEQTSRKLQKLIDIGEALAQKYEVVVTNPPYIGNGNIGEKLAIFIKNKFNDGRNDLFGIFILKCMSICKSSGLLAMITQHQWMFLSSYKNIRNEVMNHCLINMAHLGARAFNEITGEVVQTTSFVLSKQFIPSYIGKFVRLTDFSGECEKAKIFLSNAYRYTSSMSAFKALPGFPMVYWIGRGLKNLFKNPPADSVIALREGIHTGKNDEFLRMWHEVVWEKIVFSATSEEDVDKIGTWVPYNKGGTYRKWYGNNDLVIGFDKEHRNRMSQLSGHVRPSQSLYFKHGGTWSALASGKFGLRYYPDGFLFDSKGQVAVGEKYLEIITLFNLKAYQILADMLMPTLDYKCGDVKKLPYCRVKSPKFIELGKQCIELSKEEYDSYETSWDFIRHPLIGNYTLVSNAFMHWKNLCDNRYQGICVLEEQLNTIFNDEYELTNEISGEIDKKFVTIKRADLKYDIKSFISYAVGCMFGRYSLDVPGLVYAGGTWEPSKYITFPADADAILPICDDEYFEDDIVGLFIIFVEKVYGKETLEENLQFIADALGGKGTSREIIRNYFMNGFYSDHVKVYQKRPIYWLFDSGKKNGFKCLIYLHRYKPDTIARIRTDYIHEQQSRYRTAIEDLNRRIDGALPSEKVKLNKQLTKVMDQAEEIRVYEEKIHHLADQMFEIDLDDGVKVNYAKFQDVLAEIK